MAETQHDSTRAQPTTSEPEHLIDESNDISQPTAGAPAVGAVEHAKTGSPETSLGASPGLGATADPSTELDSQKETRAL